MTDFKNPEVVIQVGKEWVVENIGEKIVNLHIYQSGVCLNITFPIDLMNKFDILAENKFNILVSSKKTNYWALFRNCAVISEFETGSTITYTCSMESFTISSLTKNDDIKDMFILKYKTQLYKNI